MVTVCVKSGDETFEMMVTREEAQVVVSSECQFFSREPISSTDASEATAADRLEVTTLTVTLTVTLILVLALKETCLGCLAGTYVVAWISVTTEDRAEA